MVPSFTNENGEFSKVSAGPVSDGYTLSDYSRKDSASSALVNGWRNPNPYTRIIINRRALAVGSDRYGLHYFAGLNDSITALVAHLGYRWWGSNPSFDENLANETIANARNSLGNGKLQLANSILESRQTINLLAGTSLSFLKFVRAVKHGDLRYFQKFGKNIATGKTPAKLWIEYQYGVKPLINDVHTAYVMCQGIDHSVHNLRAVSSRNRGFSYDEQYPYLQSTYVSGSGSEGCRVRFDGLLQNSDMQRAQQLGLINPLAIAWEAVPWSFALDWFMPIGNYLSSISATSGVSCRGVTVSQRLQGSGLIREENWLGQDGLTKVDKFGLRRLVYSDFPIGAPYVSTKNPFSTTHVANALALFRQLVH
jgi:hypothetical protein